ncbi:MAG: hypothetical protein H6558_16910 [Lewinellaceae bacterium]|nr:hypothetical protein [Lewinellaceae bacterium]
MSTTLMIILGISGIVLSGYLFAQLTRVQNEPPQQPNIPPQAYPPNTVIYQPQPTVRERAASGIALWPVFVLITVAAIIILPYIHLAPAERGSQPVQKESPNGSSNDEAGPFDYGQPEQEHYYDQNGPEEKYTAPFLYTPQSDSQQAGTTPEGYEYHPPKATDLRQRYGVQVFATESGWWDEAHLRRIQQAYPNQMLLIGAGYTSDGTKIVKAVLGSFSDRTEASRFARSIKGTFPGAFPVKLSELEEVKWYREIPKA